MENIKLNIAIDFNERPGGRFKSMGDNSGEEFYDKLLKPKFLEALAKGLLLEVDLDNTRGYGSSFLDQSFGLLHRDYPNKEVEKVIILKSVQRPDVIRYIKERIWNVKGL